MAAPGDFSKPIDTIEDAVARIKELEIALDQSISLLVKRDDQILAYERRIITLEQKLDIAVAANNS
ncbi:MAG: hypothetical protein O3C57_04945 [Verrucomicrobia bacterium]|nr:hypothetical protein [Verrucomicrobiota bacterium]